MANRRIAVIGGDGIGPEVIDQAIRVADAAVRKESAVLDWNRLPWSSAFYKQTGRMMPEDGWEQLRRHDAILLGAIGSPDVPDHVTLHGLLLPMRRLFDQYVNLPPADFIRGPAAKSLSRRRFTHGGGVSESCGPLLRPPESAARR